MLDGCMHRLNEIQLCGIKTEYWRQFLKAFQESTTDAQIRVALDRLRRRVHHSTDTASQTAQSARVILAELERLLDINMPD
jgi:hypothetical protein